MRAWWCFLVLVVWLAVPLAAPQAGPESLCLAAIGRAETAGRLPRGLLGAVALSESGRRDPDRGSFVPWPWTVNNAGDGRYFATEEEAIAWVAQLQAEGKRNIDVGCMQVNLMHHPDAFADLDQALDPATNVAYGARFLAGLHDETSSWDRAVERYHTADPGPGAAYRERVYANWDNDPSGNGTGAGTGGLLQAAVLAPPRTAARSLASLEPGPRFFPISADARRGFLPLRQPMPGSGAPMLVTPTRVAPGVLSLLPRRSAGLQLAPAPGRIAVMTGGFLAPTRPVRPATGAGLQTAAAGAIMPAAID